MKAIWRAILVIFMPFWASRAFSAETPQPFRIFDVIQISCESGARPDYDRVFPPGAVIKMKEDVVKAFAKAGGESSSVVLRYPIAIEGLDPSAPPPCKGGDALKIELKKHVFVTGDVADF